MQIFLIRHGECENQASHNYSRETDRLDPSLVKRGIEQAKERTT